MKLLRFIISKVGISGIISFFLGFFGTLLINTFCFGTLEQLCDEYTFSLAFCLVSVMLLGFAICVTLLFISSVIELLNRLKW